MPTTLRLLPRRRLVTPADVTTILSHNLRHCRRKSQRTQHQVALQLSVAPSTLGSYEEGRAQPSYHMLAQLAETYGLTAAQLLGAERDEE